MPPVPDRETSQLGTEIDFLLLTSRASANHELLRINELVMENRLISSHQLVVHGDNVFHNDLIVPKYNQSVCICIKNLFFKFTSII